MTFEEFKREFYPSKTTLERMVMEEFIDLYCPLKNTTSIKFGLATVDINSLEDLRNADEDTIRHAYRFGKKRIEAVKELQEELRALDR